MSQNQMFHATNCTGLNIYFSVFALLQVYRLCTCHVMCHVMQCGCWVNCTGWTLGNWLPSGWRTHTTRMAATFYLKHWRHSNEKYDLIVAVHMFV